MKNKAINLIDVLPKGLDIEKLSNSLVRISCKTTGRGNNPAAFVLPETIIIDKELIEGISMYLGDGKLSKDLHHLQFESKDRELIRFMHDFFRNRFNIKGMYYRLTYKNLSDDSVEKWADYMGISKKSINLNKSNRHKEECFGFQIGGRLFRELFGKIINKTMKMELNTELRQAFLRGLFAAEGGIGIVKKENYVAYLAFHLSYTKEKKLANFVQKLLRLEGISSKQIMRKDKGERYIQITNWKNYHKCWKIGLFGLCIRKREKFLDKLIKTKFSCKINEKLKNDLFKSSGLNQRQLAFKIGVSPATICYHKKECMFINVEYLMKLSELAKVPVSIIKKNIVEFRVNDVTTINDLGFIDFIFELKDLKAAGFRQVQPELCH